MKALYLQSDAMTPYTPTTEVAAGEVVLLGNKVAICGRLIPANTLGALYIEGVFRVAKAAVAIAVGDDLYWDATNGVVTTTPAAGANIWFGTALSAAASGDATVDALLGEDRVPRQPAVTDNSGGTAGTTIAAITDVPTKDAIASIVAWLKAARVIA